MIHFNIEGCCVILFSTSQREGDPESYLIPARFPLVVMADIEMSIIEEKSEDLNGEKMELIEKALITQKKSICELHEAGVIFESITSAKESGERKLHLIQNSPKKLKFLQNITESDLHSQKHSSLKSVTQTEITVRINSIQFQRLNSLNSKRSPFGFQIACLDHFQDEISPLTICEFRMNDR
jgi:hypothetical protein